MTMPKSLLDRADAQVSQALKTGARGQTTINTDYGVIGDAFFKKAQLDLQIADLHANMGMRKAEVMSGLEIQKAKLNLDATQLQIDAGFKAAEMKAMAEDRKVSFAEQLMGTIGGAASGAMSGYAATGTPQGAMMGGAIGGGMTMIGYQQGGRRGGQQAQQTLGHISDLSIAYKGMKDEQTQKDAWTGVMKSGKAIMDQLNTAKTPQERLSAMQKMEGFYGEAFQVGMSMPGANPEKVGSMVASMRKGFEAAGGMGGSPEQNRQNMRQLENLVKYQGDERSSDPKQQRAWANDYMRDSAAIYEEENGKAMPINMQRKAAYDLSPVIGEALDKKLGGGNTNGSFGSMPGSKAEVLPSAGGNTQKVMPSAPEQETVTSNRPAPETGRMIGQGGGIPFAPGVYQGPSGVQMDDGGSYTPVKDEQALAKQGGETAETVQKMGMLDKIKHNMSLEDDEFDEKKIPLWESANSDDKRLDSKEKKVAPVSTDRFKKKNAELDQQAATITGSGSAEAKRGESALSNINEMIDMVENDQFPSGSMTKEFGAKVFKEGVDVGGAAGAVVGAIATKGTAQGIATGAFLGNQSDMKVGKGKGPFLSDEEELALSDMNILQQDAITNIAKIQDPGGRIAKDDYEALAPLWPSPGKSKEVQLAGLLKMKELTLRKMSITQKAETEKSDQKMKEFEEKERIKTEQQAIRARNKANNTQSKAKGSFIPLF